MQRSPKLLGTGAAVAVAAAATAVLAWPAGKSAPEPTVPQSVVATVTGDTLEVRGVADSGHAKLILVGTTGADASTDIIYALQAHGWKTDETTDWATLETQPNAPTAQSSYYAQWKPADDAEPGSKILTLFPTARPGDFVVMVEPGRDAPKQS